MPISVVRTPENGRVWVKVKDIDAESKVVEEQVPVAAPHANAIDFTHKKIHGEEVTLPVIQCDVVNSGSYCVVCKKKGEACIYCTKAKRCRFCVGKGKKRVFSQDGIDKLHIPRERSLPIPEIDRSGEPAVSAVGLAPDQVTNPSEDSRGESEGLSGLDKIRERLRKIRELRSSQKA